MARFIFLLAASVQLVLILNIGTGECSGRSQIVEPVVTTQSGPIRGGESRTVGAGKPYYFFRGIPYAEPPIGKLRFQPPVPVRKWVHVLNATIDKDECVQGVDPVTGSENCLTINVHTPQLPLRNSTGGLAVMVWIYGGGYTQGNSSYYEFGPDFLLDDNVVVVTFNYRLGIFGFLSTGDLVVPGNNGLKDQVLALRWVQRNIASFGGDPNKVTIFGYSAGASSVSLHLQSPLSKGLYRAAIMESGTSLNLWALSKYAKPIGLVVGDLLNVNTSTSESLVDGLRKIDFRTLQEVSITENLLQFISASDSLITFIHGPVVEPDHPGAFFRGKSHQKLYEGDFNRVPVIIGFNSEEMGSISPVSSATIERVAGLDQLTPVDMNVDPLTSTYVGYLIRKHYMGFRNSTDQSNLTISYLSDTLFNRPIREAVRLQSCYAPVYYYQFTYEGDLGGFTRIYPGTYHVEELRYIWLTTYLGSTGNPTGLDEVVRARMVRLWTNFAKYMNPTPSSDPGGILGSIHWPTSRKGASITSADATLKYLDIGSEMKIKENPKEKNWQFWSNLYRFYGNPPYQSY